MKKEPRTFQIITGDCVSNIPWNSRAGAMYLIFNLILEVKYLKKVEAFKLITLTL